MSRSLLLAIVLSALLVSCIAAHVDSRRLHGALNRRLRGQPQEAGAAPPQWLTQVLDHNDPQSTTFKQLYYVNDTYYVPSAPKVFLMVGGEGAISPAYVSDHFIISDLAREHGALITTLEHRFYGQSVPNGDSSTENLKFLSSAQALEDLVAFREHLIKQYSLSSSTKYIIFGGSYPGMLAGFARAKYPNLWHGAFATSAPVQATLDFSSYFDVVSRSLGPQCSAVVKQSTDVLTQLLSSDRAKLQSAFNLCGPIVTDEDAMNFMSAVSDPISGIVQYNNDNNNYEMYDITTLCGKLTSAPSPLEGLLTVWNDFNTFSNNTQCTDISYANFIKSMQTTSDGRSWFYQTCKEFGFFQTAEGDKQPFSTLITLQSYLQQCEDIFGIKDFSPNTQFTNDYYGGDAIISTNTVWVNGNVDPWSALGNYQTYPASAQSDSILVPGTAHCADLYPPRDSDLPALKQAREQQAALLDLWLKQ